jgi:CMP-N,N'-diacetyllegionaminic acid synthase
MNIIITICARGGSKGIPGKNIKLLDGMPLIVYSIKVAKKFQQLHKNVNIVLSTDSSEIKQVAEQYGLKSEYNRPDSLAGDSIGKIDAITDVLNFYENKNRVRYDFLLDLDVTSPLRTVEDLNSAFEILKANKSAYNIFSVSPANRSPYFNMVEKKENGFYAQVIKPDSSVFSRQAAPKVYDMNASFYFYKRSFFDLGFKGAITDKSLIYVVPHLCFDLDHPIDFEFMSFVLENNKLDFCL